MTCVSQPCWKACGCCTLSSSVAVPMAYSKQSIVLPSSRVCYITRHTCRREVLPARTAPHLVPLRLKSSIIPCITKAFKHIYSVQEAAPCFGFPNGSHLTEVQHQSRLFCAATVPRLFPPEFSHFTESAHSTVHMHACTNTTHFEAF